MSKKSKLRKQSSASVKTSGNGPQAKESSGGVGDSSPRVHQRDKIDWNPTIRQRYELTARQKEIIDVIMDKKTKIVFLTGPAGTSKTWLAIYCGLMLIGQRRMSHMTFVRTIIESASKSLGSLPGEAAQKMEPYLMPLMDKLDDLLPANEIKRLMTDDRIRGLPINYLRGASLNAQYIVLEEAQNYTLKEMTTALTRIGEYSKIVVIGDPDQSDINGASGFMPMFDLFNDESSRAEGIRCLALTKDDIVRSGVLRYIAERLEHLRAAKAH